MESTKPWLAGKHCVHSVNCTKFGQLILMKIIKVVVTRCHQMSDFKAKMHQIRRGLGLRPRPRSASLQRSTGPQLVEKGLTVPPQEPSPSRPLGPRILEIFLVSCFDGELRPYS